MGKDVKSMKGKKVPLKFYIYAEDIVELKQDDWDIDFVEEFGDFKENHIKYAEYVINNYITLKFERGTTQIYIDGKKFIQCIRLILHIPYSEVEKYDEIKSIDDAIDIYRKRSHQINIVEGPGARPIEAFTPNITPKEEFRGHCSNIEAWAENDYNTCILHSNIAFPMLKKLAEVGDPIARRVFKEEIASRYEMGDQQFRINLRRLGYLKFLTKEELNTLKEVVRENWNSNTNRYKKPSESSHSSSSIHNFVSYYIGSIRLYDAKKRRDFIESCNQRLIKLYRDSFRKKNQPQSKKDVANLITKRKILLRDLENIKSEMNITGKLIEFLKTVEVLIRHHDPNDVEAQLDSFKITS